MGKFFPKLLVAACISVPLCYWYNELDGRKWCAVRVQAARDRDILRRLNRLQKLCASSMITEKDLQTLKEKLKESE